MKSFDSELKKYTEKVRLRATERRELRERILTYMEYHPLPKQARKKATSTLPSENFVTVRFNTLYTRMIAGALTVLLLIVVPVAAERSVPGDMLYPVKTQINESLRSQFVNSPYEQVTFETELLERRVSEARLLAREGRLTEEVEASIAQTVRGHADAAQKGLAALKSSDADEAAIAEISYGSALEVQSAVLGTSMGNSATATENGIANALREAQANASAQKGTTTPSYERLMARVEMETTRAYELFESIKEPATDEERAKIERRLADVERSVKEAQELHEEDENDAPTELAQALAQTQKLIAFMTDIDVRENVALDTLIPILLTDEERRVLIDHRITASQTQWEEISARTESLEDAAISEKVSVGSARVKELFATATSALAEGDIEAAEGALAEIEPLIADLVDLTGASSTSTTTPSGNGEGSEEETSDENEDPAEDDDEAATSSTEQRAPETGRSSSTETDNTNA